MNDNFEQDHSGKNKFGCNLFTELCSRNTQALPRIFRDWFENPKNPFLDQAPPKNTCQIFLPKKKTPEIENFKPKKILRSSPSLEIQSTPLGVTMMMMMMMMMITVAFTHQYSFSILLMCIELHLPNSCCFQTVTNSYKVVSMPHVFSLIWHKDNRPTDNKKTLQ